MNFYENIKAQYQESELFAQKATYSNSESFLKKMRDQEEGESGRFSNMLSTHPPTALRIEKSYDTRISLPKKNYDKDDYRFSKMKKHLKRFYKKKE